MTDQSDLKAATDWTVLTQQMIAMAPELNRERLKDAIDNLAAKCNECWEDVNDNNAAAEFTGDDLGIDLTGIGDAVAVAFAGTTAVILLGGRDGPFVSALALKESIDLLANDIESRQA